MAFQVLVLMSAVLLLHTTMAKVYYVVNNDRDFISSNDTESANSLEYYIKNVGKYFSCDSQFHFKMGHHYLSTDLIIQDVTNVALTGESSCIIRCTSHVSIIIFNVTNFRLKKITFENCTTNYSSNIHSDFSRYYYTSISKPGVNASVLLYQCMSVEISNITIITTEGTTGMLVVNARKYLKITNIQITVQTNCCPAVNDTSLQTSGILLYYDNWKNLYKKSSEIYLDNFQFKSNVSCSHPVYYAITVLFQSSTSINMIIQNMIFMNLMNVSALYYFSEMCGIRESNNLFIRNCIISHNTGNLSLKMFHLTLYNMQCILLNIQKQVTVRFQNCKFENNFNISSMIYVTTASSRVTTGYFYLLTNTFHSNRNTHFLVMKSDTDNFWQLSNDVMISSINMSSNVHDEGQDLMSFTNSRVIFNGPIIIEHNRYYTNIVNFHLSFNILRNTINIANNTVRQILSSTFLFLENNAAVNIMGNTVYTLLNNVQTYSINSEPICIVQFYNSFNIFNISKFSTHIVMSNNIYMISKYLPNHMYGYRCRWLAGNVFQMAGLQSEFVYGKILEIENNTAINKDKKRPIPLSICKCVNHSPCTGAENDYSGPDCYSSNLGSIFPGQTLKVEMMVAKQWLYHHSSTVNIVVYNTEDDDCIVVDTFELSQTHFNHGCNNYSYTLWPKNQSINVCELFIGLQNMPEMFYVQLKPCPLGFTLQESRKSCYCDPVLANNEVAPIKSCNLDDETIFHPAYSWISAKLDNNTNNITYVVSSYCPFEHCLPYQSHLQLSNPDSQCQFNRAGLLCGECQQGLSTVFGSQKCKTCSNIYLLMIIPIAIIGLVFVSLLYIFNLTVLNGTIHTCIFYVNIINLNAFMFFPNCHSITCVILAYMSFNFRVTACFYNGMDDYVKAWLYLVLPFYLISIAIAFIILSRYSVTVQRFTAKKALPVLATLFLFSYTSILITVCDSLFRYSRVTYLPSSRTEVLWSISTTTPLFGVKFLALFIVCIILFLILLPFNLILLFTRTLSCLKVITMFKPILDTYFGTFKDSAYYWTGLLLLIRTIVYVLLIINEDMRWVVISVILGGLLCLHAAVQPFKTKFGNIQECLTILNLLGVHVALLNKKNSIGIKIAKALITVGITYFMLAIVFHCCMYRCNRRIQRNFNGFLLKLKSVFYNFCKVRAPQPNHSGDMDDEVGVVNLNYHEFQEPLLAVEAEN